MLTQQELDLIKKAKASGKSKEQAIAELAKSRVATPPTAPAPQKPSFLKSLATGAVKGFTEGAISTANMFQEAGRFVQAGVTPNKTYGDLKNEANSVAQFNPMSAPLDGSSLQSSQETLKADNNVEKAGKVLQFVGSMLYPVSATKEVAPLTAKSTQVAGAQLQGIGSRINSVSDDVLDGGVKLKDKLIDLVSGLDDKTKTALSRTPKDVFERFVKQGQDALVDDRNRTPLESVGDAVINAIEELKSSAGNIGAQKQQLLAQNSGEKILDLRGVKPQKGDVVVPNKATQRIGATVQQTVKELSSMFKDTPLDAGDTSIVKFFQTELEKLGTNPTLGKLDATIDMLQGKLYTSSRNNAVEVTDKVTGQLRQAIGKLNNALKEQVGGDYAKLNDEYAKRMTLINELNARVGKEGASAGAFVKRLFSPSDARTKKLFEELESMTGQDFFRDARLAKFVMDALGDTRGKSLLEEIPTSASGIVDKAIKFGLEKVADPIAAARRKVK